MTSPNKTRQNFPDHVRIEQRTHAGLWLDKYLANANEDSEKEKIRHKLIKEVSEQPIPAAYITYFECWKKLLIEYGVKAPREAYVKGRMVVGLGSESVVETSISLHRTYGVPYIPGSALKGLAANYARLYLGTDWNLNGEYYKVIFGDTDDSGYITFFDALYVPGSGHLNSDKKEQALYPDVITVHHKDYYQNRTKAPKDSDNPTPVPFLSATGAYLIALAAPDLERSDEWIALTFQVLGNALKTLGVGAKTSSGYGRMELELSPAKPIDPDLKKAEGYKQELDALKDIAGQIHGYYQKWQQIKSEEGRILLARAIVEKVWQAGREKVSAEKAWYRELRAFLEDK